MSATAGCSSVMPVSTSTRASGWSITCTQTGHRSPSTSSSATSTGVMVGGVGTRQFFTAREGGASASAGDARM